MAALFNKPLWGSQRQNVGLWAGGLWGSQLRGVLDPLQELIRTLFGNGEQGAFYIPQPVVLGAQSLFQDAAGTVPVTADGDPVGKMQDQSPNSNSAIQSVSANRAAYNTDGTVNFAAFDGIDDFLQATYGAAVTPPCTLSIAMRRLDSSRAAVLLTGLNVDNRHQLSINSQGNLGAFVGGTSIIAGSLAIGDHVVTLVLNGASSSLRVDGLVVASGTMGSVAATGLTIASVWDGSFPLNQDVYGIVHAEGIGKVDDIESYLAGLAGVTL